MWGLSQPLITQAPKIEYPETDRLIVIQGNSVMAQASHLSLYQMKVLGILTGSWAKEEIITVIKEKYPEKANLLIYMVEKESTYCQKMRGDNGLAYGCFQIHIDSHDITEECAMDFLCSLDYTVKKIEEGYCRLWTSCRNYYEIK